MTKSTNTGNSIVTHLSKRALEDTIEYLEVSSMELEIKSVDETGTKKKLLGKALLKKKKD